MASSNLKKIENLTNSLESTALIAIAVTLVLLTSVMFFAFNPKETQDVSIGKVAGASDIDLIEFTNSYNFSNHKVELEENYSEREITFNIETPGLKKGELITNLTRITNLSSSDQILNLSIEPTVIGYLVDSLGLSIINNESEVGIFDSVEGSRYAKLSVTIPAKSYVDLDLKYYLKENINFKSQVKLVINY